MSLRGRLWLVIALAAATLAISVLAIMHALRSTDAARVESANAAMTATASALAKGFSTLDSKSLKTAAPIALRQQSEVVISSTVPDTRIGYCSRSGELFAVAARGRNGEPQPSPKPLPPDQQDAVAAACRNGKARSLLKHPGDSILVLAVPVAFDGSAWVLRRVESRDDDDPWTIYVALLSAATAILVGATLTTMIALNRGVTQVRGIVRNLEQDLRAPVDSPRETEFASVTDSLVQMSRHLADANDRESALQRDLNHRERLAGLGRVVAGVAHEIRNPLAGLKLRLDVMIRASDLGPSASEDVRACLEDVARLDRVVQSLLTVSRKSEPDLQLQDIGALVEQRVRVLGAPRIHLDLARAYDAFVDRDGFIRVLDNLLRNALEAAGTQGYIAVKLHQDAEWVDVAVIDNGPGVPESVLPKLFEPFFTTKPEGTGLGLWLSRGLIETAGGTLTHQRTNSETIFRIRLPRLEQSQ